MSLGGLLALAWFKGMDSRTDASDARNEWKIRFFSFSLVLAKCVHVA